MQSQVGFSKHHYEKASGGDGIPVELFHILKDDAVKVLHSICQQIWTMQQWWQDWNGSVFIPIKKRGNAKECSSYCTIVLFSYASKVMLNILQVRLQQYVKCELPDAQTGFRKGRGTRAQVVKHPLDHQKSKRVPGKHLLLLYWLCQSLWLCSVQFSHSVMSKSLWPHEPQHARPPCPSSTCGVYPNPRPLSRWCHPTISSSVVPFPSCPQSFPTSGSSQMNQLFTLGGQSIGISASKSVLPMNNQDWSPLGGTGLIFLQAKGLESSPTPQFKSISSSVLSFLYSPSVTSIHGHWKNHSLD